MFKTEVVQTKNFRKSVLYIIFQAITFIIVLFILANSFNFFGKDAGIGKWITNHYDTIIQPVFIVVVVILLIISFITTSQAKNPKRLGIIELDEQEIRFLVNDELKESYSWDKLTAVSFKFFSMPRRGNPLGSMNYLTLHSATGGKSYEIVVSNSLTKAELGELFIKINRKIPVKITYTQLWKKFFRDTDFRLKRQKDYKNSPV